MVIASFGFTKNHVVSQKDKEFSVKELDVEIGDTVTFRNDEKRIRHNVYSQTPGREFSIRVQRPKQEHAIHFKKDKFKPGKVSVRCAIHPNMKLEINLKEKKK